MLSLEINQRKNRRALERVWLKENMERTLIGQNCTHACEGFFPGSQNRMHAKAKLGFSSLVGDR
jgi:hypothetical protein